MFCLLFYNFILNTKYSKIGEDAQISIFTSYVIYSPGIWGNGGVVTQLTSPSIQGGFLGNSSDALMYCMSVSPLLALPTLNLLQKIILNYFVIYYENQ